MDSFKLKHFDINSDHTNSKITKFDDLDEIVNTLYMCFKNKEPCVITDNSINKFKLNGDINIVYKYQIYYLTWVQFETINNFFYDKFTINDTFSITPSIFNIFMLKLIDKNFKHKNDSGISLISPSHAIFGIYNSYEYIVTNCKHYLYFSFKLMSFILYRVHDADNHIVGKLVPQIKITNNYISVHAKQYKLPNSFIKVRDTIYGLRKRKNIFNIREDKTVYTTSLIDTIGEYYDKSHVKNTYVVQLKYNITKSILRDLYKYIILTFPFLEDKNNTFIYNPSTFDNTLGTFGIYIKTINNNYQTLVVQLSNRYGQFISKIIAKIVYFLKNITTNNNIDVYPHILVTSRPKELIHIVSELYYCIWCILLFTPKIIYNLTAKCDGPYIHANYIFSSKEVHLLYDNKNQLFDSNIQYLQSIFIKTLSVNMFNNYCILRTNSDINIIPIQKNMTSKNIISLLNRGKKAALGKTFVWSMMNHIKDNIKTSTMELPFVFINIDNLDDNCIDITNKIYTLNYNVDVPIFINVLVNNNSMHISISYKKTYLCFKEAFDIIINQLAK